ncbi:LOW QUALITY PROTEIN: ubiquitin-like protein ATG12 [Leptosomus discolor]
MAGRRRGPAAAAGVAAFRVAAFLLLRPPPPLPALPPGGGAVAAAGRAHHVAGDPQPSAAERLLPHSEGGEGTPEGGAAAAADAAPRPAGSPGTGEPAGDAKRKLGVLLKAGGGTSIAKSEKWAVEHRTAQGLVDVIQKFLKLMASQQVFIYVNQSFAPSPDREVETLYECFGSDGKLVLHYCKTQAWG